MLEKKSQKYSQINSNMTYYTVLFNIISMCDNICDNSILAICWSVPCNANTKKLATASVDCV